MQLNVTGIYNIFFVLFFYVFKEKQQCALRKGYNLERIKSLLSR